MRVFWNTALEACNLVCPDSLFDSLFEQQDGETGRLINVMVARRFKVPKLRGGRHMLSRGLRSVAWGVAAADVALRLAVLEVVRDHRLREMRWSPER